ncbi:MAG: hypothetical protein EZS28_003023 [Streblomastix strix]|uniref:Calcineurin-like phosphoesterase domain-containing protein n=1 Tax=Streblomastix strix TaxID=222440 RepID=A0A5J4X276_9EUKA|nr:MAG: hypothetical protein EZS28_003023 [Streblomastix strix]
MICYLAGVFHFISGLQILIYTLLTFYYNDTPQLHYEQRENFVNASGIIGNSSNGIAWFIHCSDIHIGESNYLADYAKSYFDEVVHDLVKPFVVINSGDMVEGRIGLTLGITHYFTDEDPFSIYASCGFEKRHASQYEQLQSELSNPEILDSNHVFLVSHYNSPSLDMDTRHKIQKILKQGKLNENDELHRRNIWGFISGHIHSERMDTTRDQRRYVEAQVAAMLESQLFRIYVIDNELVSFIDCKYELGRLKPGIIDTVQLEQENNQTNSSQLPPIIYGAITNPPNVMQITQRVPHWLVKNSTHIRALIFSQRPIIKCWVDILTGVDELTKWVVGPQLYFNRLLLLSSDVFRTSCDYCADTFVIIYTMFCEIADEI